MSLPAPPRVIVSIMPAALQVGSMKYDSLIVLIPGHGLEDFPTEIGENEAASLLNAFAVVWHPALLASAGALPMWHRADAPPEFSGNRLVIVPTACDSTLPGGWAGRARMEGATVVSGVFERGEMLRECLTPLEGVPPVDSELVADFLALGTSYLLTELLTRKMHYYSNLDEAHLQREAVAAANAALAGDAVAARARLQACFEVLTSARERFYPVDCYLIDICLLIPRLVDEHFDRMLESTLPVNVLVTARDLDEIGREKPEAARRLREAWDSGRVDVIGGEYAEGPSPLMGISSILWDFRLGHHSFRKWCGRTPTTWARRRFGFTPLVPQLLMKRGYRGALHVALDDGIYPDTEQSRIRWEGCDGSLVDAATRIPLAADPATTYLRFASRMAESMEGDQTAAVLFARWPEIKAPWFDDLHRTQAYSPCLGRWVTFERYFETGEAPGRLCRYEAREYFTPFLIQAVARQEKDPISRFRDHLQRRQRFDAAQWCDATASVLKGAKVSGELETDLRAVASSDGSSAGSEAPPIAGTLAFESEQIIEEAGPDASGFEGNAEAVPKADALLSEFVPRAAKSLADVILSSGGGESGALVLNPLSFARRVTVDLPSIETPPALQGPVKGVQFDGVRKTATVEVPPCGFLWVPSSGPRPAAGKSSSTPMVEDLILRNEFFEVYVNEATGGIARIKGYGRSPNRLSEQICYRFPRERVVPGPDGEPAARSYYSTMRCDGIETTSNGPGLAEVVSRGQIIDPQEGAPLAGFRQTIRVWRGRPAVEIEIELDVKRMPDGDPWTNYYAVRFAWNDSAAVLTRSLQEGAHGFQGERIESPHYIEIAEGEQRTTILPLGLPFHRKTGPRMLDSMLIAAGETARKFRFIIVTDADYPMQAALDAMTPPIVVPAQSGPPRSGTSGWLFHLDAKNVQLIRVMGLDTPADAASPMTQHDFPATPPEAGFAVRLLETEGRRKKTKLRCFRTPTRARQRDFQGRTLSDLAIDGDAVSIELAPYEIADVELFFGPR